MNSNIYMELQKAKYHQNSPEQETGLLAYTPYIKTYYKL